MESVRVWQQLYNIPSPKIKQYYPPLLLFRPRISFPLPRHRIQTTISAHQTWEREEEKKMRKVRVMSRGGGGGGGKVRVRMRLDRDVEYGEEVGIMGSTKELGEWKKMVPMHWTELGWVCYLELELTDSIIEYKFVILKKDNTWVWECGNNRVLKYTTGPNYHMVCHWNATAEAINLHTNTDDCNCNCLEVVEEEETHHHTTTTAYQFPSTPPSLYQHREEEKLKIKSRDGKVRLSIRLDHQVEFGQHVVLLGSTRELGEWKKIVPLHWTKSGGWVCELELTGGEYIEYKFVIVNSQDNSWIWECGGNRVLKLFKCGVYNMVCHWNATSEPVHLLPLLLDLDWQHNDIDYLDETQTQWENNREEENKKISKSKYGKVRLSIRVEHQVEFGEQVVVVGSTTELGEWKKIVPMHWTNSGWECNLELTSGQDIEYKFVILKKDNTCLWESGTNRVLKLFPSTGPYYMVCHWNATAEPVHLLDSQQNDDPIALPVPLEILTPPPVSSMPSDYHQTHSKNRWCKNWSRVDLPLNHPPPLIEYSK